MNGNVVGVIGVGQDVTERKRAELEMTRVAKELQTFIDTANAPIFRHRRQRAGERVEQQGREITGFSKAEVMGTRSGGGLHHRGVQGVGEGGAGQCAAGQ